jgi:hypothetical protein
MGFLRGADGPRTLTLVALVRRVSFVLGFALTILGLYQITNDPLNNENDGKK